MSAPANPVHSGIHHLKLPVTDLERSADWYRTVLGAHRLTELDHRRADGTLFAVILDVPGFPGRLELRLDPVTAKALNGYDLLTLSVTDRVAIDDWVARLNTLDIPHSPPIVALIGWLLVVPDPDGLRLRFYTTEPHRLGADAVEFDSPWLGAGVVAETASAAGESAVCAVARLTALPGYRDRVLARMRSLEDIIRQEDGCLAYLVHTENEHPNTIVVYESWADQAALDAHHKTAHMEQFARFARPLVDWPPQQDLLTPLT
ncbi:antibiotic biosynthesis monooxygenase [Nocardia sp. NBC_01327]|uniref:antibiotic biosynthesis monooxygenase n=1 Tax=Nocardia sp. NBC_01327 TaxID=2903593 RepID=UPI002E14F128|nr:antibiotic biosynthesis monooxygenase [Nocardia sp. NBC_01327]